MADEEQRPKTKDKGWTTERKDKTSAEPLSFFAQDVAAKGLPEAGSCSGSVTVFTLSLASVHNVRWSQVERHRELDTRKEKKERKKKEREREKEKEKEKEKKEKREEKKAS